MKIVDTGIDHRADHPSAGKIRPAAPFFCLHQVYAGSGPGLVGGEQKPLGLLYVLDLGKQAHPFHQRFRNRQHRELVQQFIHPNSLLPQRVQAACVLYDHFPGPLLRIVSGPQAFRLFQILPAGCQRQIQQVFHLLIFHTCSCRFFTIVFSAAGRHPVFSNAKRRAPRRTPLVNPSVYFRNPLTI